MSETSGTRVQLSTENFQRMQQLTDEIEQRLEEMARISAQTLGRTFDPAAPRKFVRREVREAKADGTEAAAVYIEIYGAPGHECCAIYCSAEGYPTGHLGWIECPCGSGPLPC